MSYNDESTIEASQRLIKHYLTQPEVSLSQHVRAKAKLVAESIAERKKVYLDTCYWIFIRDAEMGRSRAPIHEEILKELRYLVSNGSIVCPISDVTFLEILSQSNSQTRNTTSELCDELSLSIALQSERHRTDNEIEAFFRTPYPDGSQPLLQQIWTKPYNIFGEPQLPSSDRVSPELNRALHKCTVDTIWESITFTEISQKSSDELRSLDSADRRAETINTQKALWQHQIPTMKAAFLAEIQGVLSLHAEHANEVLIQMYFEQGGTRETIPREKIEETQELTYRVLINLFNYAPKKVAPRLPTAYIHSLCHAAVRFDSTRKFNGNFLRDLHHGTAAVGYFDAMFTEKPLHMLLTAGNVNVNEIFPCKIFSNPELILGYLKSLH